MANALIAPSAIIGLMGAGRRRPSLLPFFGAPEQADAADEAMFAANPNGTTQNQALAMALEQASAAQPGPAAPAAPAARARVNPLNVLFRGLAPNLSGALDTERARLQAEADRPAGLAVAQENERIARALGPAALLAFRTNAPELGESLGYQYRPQVVAEGSSLAIPGMGTNTVNERRAVVGDRVVGLGGNGQDPRELLTVSPSYDDETKRINATNPVTVAQDAQLRDPRTGALIAQGLTRPDIQNVAPGGEALVFDGSGNIVNRVGSTQVKPMSDADQAAVSKAENTLATIETASGRARSILSNIESGQLNLSPISNALSGVLNSMGRSTPNSLAFDELQNWAREARDAILASESGVKTDQDAVRALERILSSSGDEGVVKQSVQRFLQATEATANVLNRDIQRRSATQSRSGPQVGTVEDGYRFKGGDPASPSSWERVQ